ncbi:hypothetical protein Fcan01_20751 [Folsomia candida]|uniref:Uncharacterized protein n=1 Tax=Folsomia candida TaxID=158441 RepID=A0A226DIU8_FOLCA|nr:hypothetical protein Fcan01_20751 [Folsomia candida]
MRNNPLVVNIVLLVPTISSTPVKDANLETVQNVGSESITTKLGKSLQVLKEPGTKPALPAAGTRRKSRQSYPLMIYGGCYPPGTKGWGSSKPGWGSSKPGWGSGWKPTGGVPAVPFGWGSTGGGSTPFGSGFAGWGSVGGGSSGWGSSPGGSAAWAGAGSTIPTSQSPFSAIGPAISGLGPILQALGLGGPGNRGVWPSPNPGEGRPVINPCQYRPFDTNCFGIEGG